MNTQTQDRPAPLQPLSAEELKTAFQKGIPHPGLAESYPVEKMFEDALANHDRPPEEIRSWITSRIEIRYKHPMFGEIGIGVKNCSLGEPQKQGPNSWARVYAPESRQSVLEIQMSLKVIRGIKVADFRADPKSESDAQFVSEITDTDGGVVPPFPVKVEWQGTKPFTRVKHRDNLDIIMINPETGTFIQVEISITTRNGYTWLLVQEQHCGQWVRTTEAKATELGQTSIPHGRYPLLVVPLYAANAYPGADYLKTFPEIGQQMAPFVIKWGSFVPFHKCVIATWAPEKTELPEAMKAAGWKLAVPYHFNGVIGFGPVECDDKEMCFAHFSAIIDADGAPVGSRGNFPILEPMKYIALKYSVDGENKRKATAIRVL